MSFFRKVDVPVNPLLSIYSVTGKSAITKKQGCKWNDRMSFFLKVYILCHFFNEKLFAIPAKTRIHIKFTAHLHIQGGNFIRQQIGFYTFNPLKSVSILNLYNLCNRWAFFEGFGIFGVNKICVIWVREKSRSPFCLTQTTLSDVGN